MSKKYWVKGNKIIVSENGEEKNITDLGEECDYCIYNEGNFCSKLLGGEKQRQYCDWHTFGPEWDEWLYC